MNGETSIRPYRIGTSSGTREEACSSSNSTGSGRCSAGSHSPWLLRGTSARAAFPRATRSAVVKCATFAALSERWSVVSAVSLLLIPYLPVSSAYARASHSRHDETEPCGGAFVAIAEYLGKNDAFDQAIAEFSRWHAELNDRDDQDLADAVRPGRIIVKKGL